MITRLKIFTLLLTLTNISYGKTIIGNVASMRGKATVLSLGESEARSLKKGSVIFEEDSVLTYKKSFLRIKLINDSTMTLGPKSKVVVEMNTKDKTSLISLMTGKIRAKVNRNSKAIKKFLVKTRSAAMGVRGTEFEVYYNDKAQRTGLLTFSGEVAIKNRDKNIDKILKEENKDLKIDKVKDVFSDSDMIVTKGDYTNLSTTQKLESKIKVDPKQYALKKLNTTMGVEKTVASTKLLKKVIEEVKTNSNEKTVIIDDKTAFCIPKMSEAVKVDDKGELKLDKGIEVDDFKGLVAKDKRKEEIVEEINDEIEDQMVDEKALDPSYSRYLSI